MFYFDKTLFFKNTVLYVEITVFFSGAEKKFRYSIMTQKNEDLPGTRTQNLLIRSQVRYPITPADLADIKCLFLRYIKVCVNTSTFLKKDQK